MVLFRHQRRRAVSVTLKGEKSSSSMDESSDELGKNKDKVKLGKLLQPLEGFKAIS